MADKKDESKIDAERVAQAAAALAGIMTYGRSAARLGNARRAAVLLKRPGVRASTVKKWTGYERGPYGWGVETRGDASLRPAAVFGATPEGKLGAMAYVHPDVSKAYPGVLDSVSVRVVPDADWSAEVAAAKRSLSEWSKGDTASGFYDHGNNLIAVRAQMPNESFPGYLDRADKTLTHELQHVAQERDGLRPPRSHEGFDGYKADGREVEARNSANRFWLTPEERVEMPRANTQDVKPEDVHMNNKGGKSGGFKGWKAYRDAKKAAEAEAAAVAIVNAGITNAPPLSAADLADSRASAEWLKSHERRGLITEGTLPHTGRPRFYSGNGFMEGDTSFQGDRFSSIVPVDFDAYHGDAEAYKKTGRWAVIPTVYPDADGVTRLHTVDAAESEYRKSGSHFGIFEGLENAETGAQWDHHKGNADWAERETKQATKGGNNFGNFTNFLATDDVPESIFGIPVVQDESGYTESDLRFFKENPKAAGFYETGDEEDVESQEDDFGGSTRNVVAVASAPAGESLTRKLRPHSDTAAAFLAAAELIKRWERYEASPRRRLDARGRAESMYTVGEGFTSLIDDGGRETPVTEDTPALTEEASQEQLYRHLLKYDRLFRERFGGEYTKLQPGQRGAMLSVAFNAGPGVYLGAKRTDGTSLSPRFEKTFSETGDLAKALDGNLDYGTPARRQETQRMFSLGINGNWRTPGIWNALKRSTVRMMSPSGGVMSDPGTLQTRLYLDSGMEVK